MPDAVTYSRASSLRRSMTPPEARLWICLKGRAVSGLKFRRQHPVDRYILDFYCAEVKLAVEIDGVGHEHPDQARHDERRDAWLMAQGIYVLRFPALRVRDDLEGILTVIRDKALSRRA